jgi:hypothetical protein
LINGRMLPQKPALARVSVDNLFVILSKRSLRPIRYNLL